MSQKKNTNTTNQSTFWTNTSLHKVAFDLLDAFFLECATYLFIHYWEIIKVKREIKKKKKMIQQLILCNRLVFVLSHDK